MEAGAGGTETRSSAESECIVAYFDRPIDEQKLRAALLDALRIYGLPPRSLLNLKFREVADRDWLAEWKTDWQPVEVGRFIIAPPWIESVPPASAGGSSE